MQCVLIVYDYLHNVLMCLSPSLLLLDQNHFVPIGIAQFYVAQYFILSTPNLIILTVKIAISEFSKQ